MWLTTPNVVSLFRKAGWCESRRVEPDERLSIMIQSAGFDVFPAIRDLLSRFEGLKVTSKRDWICFDTTGTLTRIEPEDLAYIRQLSNGALCPFAYGGFFMFFLTGTASILCIDDAWNGYVEFTELDSCLRQVLFGTLSPPVQFIELESARVPPSYRCE